MSSRPRRSVDRVRLAVDVPGQVLGRPAELEQRLLEPAALGRVHRDRVRRRCWAPSMPASFFDFATSTSTARSSAAQHQAVRRVVGQLQPAVPVHRLGHVDQQRVRHRVAGEASAARRPPTRRRGRRRARSTARAGSTGRCARARASAPARRTARSPSGRRGRRGGRPRAAGSCRTGRSAGRRSQVHRLRVGCTGVAAAGRTPAQRSSVTRSVRPSGALPCTQRPEVLTERTTSGAQVQPRHRPSASTGYAWLAVVGGSRRRTARRMSRVAARVERRSRCVAQPRGALRCASHARGAGCTRSTAVVFRGGRVLGARPPQRRHEVRGRARDPGIATAGASADRLSGYRSASTTAAVIRCSANVCSMSVRSSSARR